MKTRVTRFTSTLLFWVGTVIVLVLLMMLAAPRPAGASSGIDSRPHHATQAELLPTPCCPEADVGVDHACLGHAAGFHCFIAEAVTSSLPSLKPSVPAPVRVSFAGAHVAVDIPPPKAFLPI